MSRQDWQAPLPIDAFSNHFTKALQCGSIPDLKLLIPAISKQSGESYWQQSYRNKGAFDNNSGAWVAQKALDRPAGAVPRRNWEAFAEADKTFANWLKRVTPHQDIDFYMTLIDKDETETGHEFESRDKLDMNLDPTSPVISMLAQGFVTKGNARIIEALTASTATRKMLDMKYYTSGTTKNPNFGKVKTVAENWTDNNPYASYTTAQEGFLSIEDDLPQIEAELDACNVPHGMRKIILLNPFDAAKVKTKNFKVLFNSEFPFVKNSDLQSGDLPEMFGFSWIKCNQIPKGTMIAFVPEAMCRVPYLDLEQALDHDIMLRNHIVYYAHEEWGVGRIDDIGVKKITIKPVTEKPVTENPSSGGGE